MQEKKIYFTELDQEITFYIGKNKNDNNDVIDMGDPDDLWFHAKDISSCHVVAIIPVNEDFTKEELMKIIVCGAKLCKENTAKLLGYSIV